MSERTIKISDWNDEGLLPIAFEHAEVGSYPRTYVLHLTPDESRELERQLHAANADQDE